MSTRQFDSSRKLLIRSTYIPKVITDQVCVFAVLTKTYDTISHEQLLRILGNVDFRGKILKFIASVLSKQ